MKKHTLCLAAAALLLGACGQNTVKQALGIDTRAPDEFRVVSRPPLSVPPQFDLRPPGIDGASTQDGARDKAQTLVLGQDEATVKTDKKKSKTAKKTVSSSSKAEEVFLRKAGAAQADPNIKKELAEKKISDQLEKEDKGWWDKVTTLPGDKEPVVKAEGEAERIQKNKAAGKPVTEGETPETGGGPVSTLKHWMGDD